MQDNKIKPYKVKDTDKRKVFIIGLIVTFVICVLLFTIIFCVEYYSNKDFLYKCLVDGFSLSGLIVILSYFLVYCSYQGAFDMLTYSIQVVFYSTFHKSLKETKVARNYAEYKQLKREKDRPNVRYMFIVGLIFLIVGLILLVPYYQLRP